MALSFGSVCGGMCGCVGGRGALTVLYNRLCTRVKSIREDRRLSIKNPWVPGGAGGVQYASEELKAAIAIKGYALKYCLR